MQIQKFELGTTGWINMEWPWDDFVEEKKTT